MRRDLPIGSLARGIFSTSKIRVVSDVFRKISRKVPFIRLIADCKVISSRSGDFKRFLSVFRGFPGFFSPFLTGFRAGEFQLNRLDSCE
jgi:hypothetical protein